MNHSPYISTTTSLEHSFHQYSSQPCFGFRQSQDAEPTWLTYNEVFHLCDIVLEKLRLAGAKEGDVVMISKERDFMWYVCDFASTLGGFVSVGVNPKLPPSEIAHLIEIINPVVIVTDEFVHNLTLSSYTNDEHAKQQQEQGEQQQQQLLHISRQAADLATLILTSGSSGLPKAVMLSDDSWSRRVYSPRASSTASPTPSFPAADLDSVWLSFQPAFHTMDRKNVWGTVFVGGRVGFHDDSHGKKCLWQDFNAFTPSRITASPAFWMSLYHEFISRGGDAEATSWVLRRLGGGIVSAAVSGAKPSQILLHFISNSLSFQRSVNAYSSSEAHVVLRNERVDQRNGVQVHLLSDGELCVHSPCMFSGYYGDPVASANSFIDINDLIFYRTGDRVVYDCVTYTYEVVDRLCDIVKLKNAEFVSPALVESQIERDTGDLLRLVYVEARPGADRVALLAVRNSPSPAYSSLLECVSALISTPLKGIVWIDEGEYDSWKASGLLNTLDKKVRRKISEFYKCQFDKLFDFDSKELCLEMQQSGDLRECLLGMIGLFTETSPCVLQTVSGTTSLSALGVDSVQIGALIILLSERKMHDKQVSWSPGTLLQSTIDQIILSAGGELPPRHPSPQLQQPTSIQDDWKLSHDLTPKIETVWKQQSHDPQPPLASIKRVFLTGATGTLGAVITADILLKHPHVHLVCLVRGNTAVSAHDRLMGCISQALGVSCMSAVHQHRVTSITGFLSEECFGIPEDVYESLVSDVDSIIHCAAAVNHVQTYEWHKAANVCGTLRVIEMACSARRKGLLPINLISTANVTSDLLSGTTVGDDSHSTRFTLLQGLNGYTMSKLGAEMLCKEAARHGCEVRVFRPGICTSHSHNGFCKTTDFYPRLLVAMLKERIYPTISGDATFDMTPVDYVAHGINHIILNPPAAATVPTMKSNNDLSHPSIQYYHPISAKHEVGFDVLVDGVRLYLNEVVAMGVGVGPSLRPTSDLTELPFAEFQKQMSHVDYFAPIKHELRSGGRPVVRNCDKTLWAQALDSLVDMQHLQGTLIPASEVTPAAVKKCIDFIVRA